jgi:leucyl aminopeptidase (aminopeptidase T)
LCKNFQKKLDNAKEISIKTQSGTDLSFRCKERKGLINDGTLKEKCTLCNLPAGEAGISVTENSADGNLVIDVSLSDIELKNPVKMKLVKGEISQIEGYEEANILKSVFEKQNKTARILSGFSLGLNKKAITIGNALNDGKVLGNCRIAFGDNVNIGGKNKSDIHIDAVLKSPTIHIDGDEVMKDGMLKSK